MELRSQLESLDSDTLRAVLDVAMVVAAADGTLTADEIGEVAQGLDQITEGIFGADELANLLINSLERYQEHGADGIIPAAADALDDTLRRVAFAMGAAAAWTRSGVQTAEGLALQQIKAAFDIEESEYFQLLADAQALSQS